MMKTKEKMNIDNVIQHFISAANNHDVDSIITLFAEKSLIDDISVGEKFRNKAGVRTYLENYFVNYKTVTKLISIQVTNDTYAEVKVDFKGTFGHETGGLNVTVDSAGLILKIDAYLD